MPTEIRSKSRTSPIAGTLDPLLATTTRTLIAVAASLAILVVIQLEIASWQAGDADRSAPVDLQLRVTSP
jgi:hypothetical protein